MKKRFFAILLCLVMIVGLLPTGALAAQAADSKYVEVSALTADKDYVLAVDNGDGKVAAITLSDGKVAAAELTVTSASGADSAYVETADANVVWKYNSSKYFANGSTYLYPGSSGMMTYSSGRALTFADGHFSFSASGGKVYYITFSEGAFGTSQDADAAASFRLFEGSAGGSSEPETPAGDPVKYFEANSLTAGNSYILAVDNGAGKVAAITLSGSSVAATELTVTPAGGADPAYVETANDNVVWKYNSSKYFANGSTYLYPGSSGMMTYSSGRALTFADGHFSFSASGGKVYYITFSEGAFGTSQDADAAASFRLFELKSDVPATPTPEAVTYELTNRLVDGVKYLIVSVNSGNGYALTNEDGALGTVPVEIKDGKITLASNEAGWTPKTNGDYVGLTNNDGWLNCGYNSTTIDAAAKTDRGWGYSNHQLVMTSGSGNHYTLYYSNSSKAFTSTSSASERTAYLFAEVGKAPACVHEGTETVLKNAKEASCTEEGYTGDTVCTVCGEVIAAGETIKKLDHTIEVRDAKEATCTEEGYTGDTVCKVCGEVIEEGTVIEKKAHTIEVKDAKEASCTETGYTGDEVCKVCGEVIKKGEVTEAKGHSWGKWTESTAPTEYDEGEETRTCSVCGETEKRAVPALGHTHVLTPVAKAPTCTEDGYEACWQCSGCYKYFSDAEGKNEITPVAVAALGHDTELQGAKDAACEETGYTGDEVCKVCGEVVKKGEVIEAKGHNEKLVIRNAKDATCTEKGYTGDAYCPDCGKLITKGEDVAALGHKWGEWTVDKAATATEDGRKTRTCSVCGETESEVIPATGETPADSNVFVRTSKLENGKSYLIVVESSSGSTYALLNEGGSSDGTSMAKVAVTISGDKIVLDNAAAVWAATAHGDYFDLTNGNDYLEGKSGKVSIFNKQNYSDRGWTYTDGHLQHKGGTNTYTVYYDSGAFTSSYQDADGTVMLFVNDSSAAPESPEPTNPPEPQDGTTYVLTDKLVDGKEYLIVSANSGSAYALTNPGGSSDGASMGRTAVTIVDGKIVTDASNVVWLAALNADANETAAKYGDCFTLTNGTDYLDGSGGKVSVYTSEQYEDRGFAYSEGQLQHVGGRNVYTVYYSSSAFTSTYNETTEKVYLFEKVDGSVTPPEECTHAKLIAHDATDSTCTEAGHEAYWECDSCGQLFSDAEGKNAIDKPVEKALAAHKLTKVEKVEATCAKAGAEEHWKCDVCGKLFSDADGKNEISAPVEIKKLDHKTELKDDKEPTCTEKGYTGDEVCSVCGEVVKKGSEIAALGHTPELKDKKEATCEEKGYSGDYYCSVCGELIAKGNEDDALGHEWDDGVVTTAPTCTKEGVMTFTCKHDSKHTYTEPIDALGHDWSEWTVTIPATETEVGYEARICSVCGERETREIPVLTHVHKLVAVAKVEPGCETAGSEACWQCEGCRKYFSDAEGKVEIEAPVVIAALGHDAEIRNAKEPTCAAEGYTGDTYCKRCGKLISEGKAIAKLAHQWGDWVETTPATETTEGVETRTCAVCGEKETRAIPVLMHEHVLVAVNGVAATCEDAGFEAYWKCSGCGKLFSDAEGKNEIEAPVVIAALGHDLVKHEAKEPTATEPGYIEYWECSECRKLFSDAEGKTEIKLEDTVIPATGEKKCDGGANCPSIVLTDVDRSAKSWYHEAVDWAFVKGIVTGTTPTTFSPKADCTREQMVTFLWRMNGSPDPKSMVSPFTDVKDPGHYAYKAILWAAEQGITNGTSPTTFSPKNNVTREQVVTLLWRMKGSPVVEGAMQFTDVTTKDYSYKAVMWAVQEGITNGRTKDTFAPKGNCTRSEIVTFLWRYAGEPAAV